MHQTQLEIYADDTLKCSHGATIERIDDEQMFYLQSRGIRAAGGAAHDSLRVCRRG